MKYFVLAGEVSGDLHASNLMKNIRNIDPNADFTCWGGENMRRQGGKILKHINELAFMGFVEVLANIITIWKNFRLCKQHILKYSPDVIILVDYPGFNLRIARYANDMGFKVIYYISPTVWAWKESRVKIIKQYVDQLFVILPFEKDFYKKHNYHVEFEGHPLMDSIAEWNKNKSNIQEFVELNRLDKRKIIALLPGSRQQEIHKILPVMLKLPGYFKDYQFVIAGTKSVDKTLYENSGISAQVKIVYDDTYNLLASSYAAIVTSGTATLETALLKIPEIVCYKTSWFSYQIARLLVNIKFISLVNLIMEKEVVKELIQGKLNLVNLKNELDKILNNQQYRKTMHENFLLLHEKLNGSGVSERIANKIVASLQSGNN